jgi:hypothetical protein
VPGCDHALRLSRLKQVTWQPPNELPDGRAPDEVQLEMVQKIAWQLGYRFEPKLEDDREPMPACKDRRTGAELEQ